MLELRKLDLQSLPGRGRRVVRLHMGPDATAGLKGLRSAVEAALSAATRGERS